MAWPCITRVCCLARFWNQLDKSDLSVPLATQNYSDISDQEVRSITKQVSATEPRTRTGSPRVTADGAGARGSFRARKEPVYKPREDYHPPPVPFPGVTQYKQDFKPWPIPRKENFPWISNGGSKVSGSPVNTHPSPGERGERGRGQQRLGEQEENKTSCYRQEYRPWTGAKPAKSARKNPPAEYFSQVSEAAHSQCRTSYQAAYSSDTHRSTGLHQGEQTVPSAVSNPQPAAAPQPIAAALPAVRSSSPPSLQQNIPPERMELGGRIKGEEHQVKTKLSPNASAVFQSGPRVFNI